MAKQPYIPLYIGDWEQDTIGLSNYAEYAFFKLKMKLFLSNKKGFLCLPFKNIAQLIKSDLNTTRAILQELSQSKLFVIKESDNGTHETVVEIISPRQNKEYRMSIRSEYIQDRINACVFTSNRSIRKKVFELYGKRCLCCDSTNKIALDHVVSVKYGGQNSIENLQPLCSSCNSKKGYKTIDYRKHD